MPDIEIQRRASPEDLPRLLQLFEHLHADDAALPADETVDATWREILDNPRMHVLVAESAGDLVSSVTLTIVPNLTRGARPYGLIENVVTNAAWRRRGIATRLLQSAREIAWSAGCYKVMLMTGSKHEAVLNFYRKAGFVDGDKTAFIARPA